MKNIEKLIRPNVKKLVPYSSARSEYKEKEGVFLDANENNYCSGNYNRYPDPLQMELKEKISKSKKVAFSNIFLGNGSDEAIDLLVRCFCVPGKDNIIINPPTYGMYEVAANINDIEVRKIKLTKGFQLNIKEIEKALDKNTKLIFICSPNNPTGNTINKESILYLLNNFEGIVILDEAYIDFSENESLISELNKYPNLVVLQTFSKAFGLANLRIGMAFGNEILISILNKIKPPYNINGLSQKIALKAVTEKDEFHLMINAVKEERKKLSKKLQSLGITEKVFESAANFILVKFKEHKNVFQELTKNKIIVRDRSRTELCEDCLRITVGTREENKLLIKTLAEYEKAKGLVY